MSQSTAVLRHVDLLLHVLQVNGVSACIIGELALNYYNVPRVVHDLEFCVDKSLLIKGSEALAAAREVFEPAEEEEFSIFTEYRRGLPRYRFKDDKSLCVVLFPDEYYSNPGLLDSIISKSLHQYDSEYSLELDEIPRERIHSLPFPLLGPLLSRYCRHYVASKDTMAAMAIDGLVDGMDLDEEWCMQHLSQIENSGLLYVLSRVRGKRRRIDYYQDNTVTCVIANEDERSRLLRVPGRETAQHCAIN